MPGLLIRISKIVFFLQLVILLPAHSQQYPFRNFGIQEGIPHAYTYTVNQDPAGFIWVGTGTGLARFNGFEFETNATGDSLPSDFPNISFRDSRGRIWFGHNNGSISVLDNNRFTILENPELRTRITGFAEDEDGNILVSSQQHGLVIADNGMNISHHRDFFGSMQVTSMAVTKNNRLLVGTFSGLYIINGVAGDQPAQAVRVPGVPAATVEKVQCFGKRGIFVSTRERGLFHLPVIEDNAPPVVINAGERYGFGYSAVRSVYIDDNDDLWVSTWGQGVYRLSGFFDRKGNAIVRSYTSGNGLQADFVQEVFQDKEGNFWFPTFSGLSMLADESISLFNKFEEPFGKNVSAVYSDDDYVWLGGDSGLLRISRNGNNHTFFGTGRGLPFDRITAIACTGSNMFIGTETSGIYILPAERERATAFHVSNNSLENNINYLTLEGQILRAATRNGVLEFDLGAGSRKHYSTVEGLPHNNIMHILSGPAGRNWIAARGNRLIDLAFSGEIRIGRGETEFTSLTYDKLGNLWAATAGSGAIMISQDTVINITSSRGLHSNFCYSIITSDDGDIWVGHRMGISRITPSTMHIRTYGPESSVRGDFNTNAVHRNADGTLYFGTTEGLLVFDPAGEKTNLVPPLLNITSVIVSDEEYGASGNLSLPYGSYRLRISFVGLNYAAPEKVRYQYKLEGYDLDWSDVSGERYAWYPRIDDGNFTFLLRAGSADGAFTEVPLSFEIEIDRPIWKKWYFFLFVAAGAGLLLLLFIKIRERRLRREKERIERELAVRTREVVEQKREIEFKNRDITDSINYAQRIQASILPPVSRIENAFSESFVFYRPRDIVSGDFYWFDRVNNNKFLIVCADSTGHGVPGAFMSMIGTTLIKDICMRPGITSPSEVLETLDREITSTLNQNVDSSVRSTDGMDITVCEFDIERNYLRFASAMRPIMMLRNGELLYIRGSRNSIGGYSNHMKSFENQGYQLNPGDIIYLFSDGYPDQFGGPMGKKFKMVRLKNLLADICDKPLEQQHEHISNNFDLWKGDHEQVDDILFMGLKV